MRKVEAELTYGMSGWPVWVHHARRDLNWRVLEVIEPRVGRPGTPPARRYVLKVHGPLAYVPGRDGTFYLSAERHGGLWWVEPEPSAYPRRGIPPGE